MMTVAQAWDFNQTEARRAFDEAIKADPTSAFAHWGVAYSRGEGGAGGAGTLLHTAALALLPCKKLTRALANRARPDGVRCTHAQVCSLACCPPRHLGHMDDGGCLSLRLLCACVTQRKRVVCPVAAAPLPTPCRPVPEQVRQRAVGHWRLPHLFAAGASAALLLVVALSCSPRLEGMLQRRASCCAAI